MIPTKTKSTRKNSRFHKETHPTNQNKISTLVLTIGPTLLTIFTYFFSDHIQLMSSSLLKLIYPKEKALLFIHLKDGYICILSFILTIGALMLPIILIILYKKQLTEFIKKDIFKLQYKFIFKKIFWFLISVIGIVIAISLSTLAFLGSIFNRIELYEYEIRIYRFLENNNIVDKKILSYNDVKEVNLKIEKGDDTDKETRYDYYYYIKFCIVSKENIEYEVISTNLFFIENEASNILDLVNIFKGKGIKININISYNELLLIIKKNYYNKNDQERIVENMQRIFFVLSLEN